MTLEQIKQNIVQTQQNKLTDVLKLVQVNSKKELVKLIKQIENERRNINS